jgi:GT2 family glycosyltransferase
MKNYSDVKIGVIIASYGRPGLLERSLSALRRQVREPDVVALSVVSERDLGGVAIDNSNVNVVYSNPGTCAQRNKGLALLRGRVDVVLFIDDDFWMASSYIQQLVRIFSTNPEVVAVTGLVLADGATSAGISVAEAEKRLEQYERYRAPTETMRDVPDTYGCNMAFRVSKIGDLEFDEHLPLYGWQEDVDFSAQLRGRGRIIWTDALWGVHLGIKQAKVSGVRFGYSQVINPLYIFRKGNMSLQRAARLICKNIAANAAKAVYPEQYIDRRGRLKGNMIGLLHAASGKLDPMQALKL